MICALKGKKIVSRALQGARGPNNTELRIEEKGGRKLECYGSPTEFARGLAARWSAKRSAELAGCYLSLSHLFADFVEMKRNLAANDFFQGDARRFVFCRIDVDARARTPLKLFAALGGQND